MGSFGSFISLDFVCGDCLPRRALRYRCNFGRNLRLRCVLFDTMGISKTKIKNQNFCKKQKYYSTIKPCSMSACSTLMSGFTLSSPSFCPQISRIIRISSSHIGKQIANSTSVMCSANTSSA